MKHREAMHSSNPFAPETAKPSGTGAPSAGQTKSYNSENARGERQPKTSSNLTAGNAAASQSSHGYGWPNLRSPSKKT